jgi:hypothetical protein
VSLFGLIYSGFFSAFNLTIKKIPCISQHRDTIIFDHTLLHNRIIVMLSRQSWQIFVGSFGLN